MCETHLVSSGVLMLSYLFQLRVVLGSLTTEKEMKRTEMPLCPRAGSGEWEL